MISQTLIGVRDRVSSSIYFGNRYNYEPTTPWSVSLEYAHQGIQVTIAEKGATLEAAFETAWSKLDQLISRGLGSSAMYAAIEHQAEAPRAFPDDEIPY